MSIVYHKITANTPENGTKFKDCIIQEIYARLIMYNFSMLITENILIDDDKRNKYRSRVNYAVAIHICIAFFRCNNVSPSVSFGKS